MKPNKVTIKLIKDMFFEGKNDYDLAMNIGNMKKISINEVDGIDRLMMGIYIIFDSFGDDNSDWETPNSMISNGIRNCLYVGEGKIKARLKYRLKQITGEHGKYIIYFEVADRLDRKLIERALIKHFKPMDNKEELWEFSDKKKYWDYKKKLINDIDLNFESCKYSDIEMMKYDSATEYISVLMEEEGYTLNEISDLLSSKINNK